MGLQPSRDRLGSAVGQKIKRSTLLQITDQGSIAVSAFPRPVVQTNNSRLVCSRQFKFSNQTSDSITTAAHALFAAYILSCLASYRKSKPTESFLQPFCALCVRTTECGKLFSKDLSCTGTLFAEEATNLNNETDETATHGKIVQGSLIVTLHSFGDRRTTRTRSRWQRCTQGNGDLIGNIDRRNVQVFIDEFWKDDHSF